MKKAMFTLIPLLIHATALAEGGEQEGGLGFPIVLVLIVALIVALIVLSRLKAQMKTAKREKMAMNYVKEGSFRLDVQQDIFLYQTEQRQKVENNKSN